MAPANVLSTLQGVLEALPEAVLVYSRAKLLVAASAAGRALLQAHGGGAHDPWRLGDLSLDGLLHRVLEGDEPAATAETPLGDAASSLLAVRVTRVEDAGARLAVVVLRERAAAAGDGAARRHAFLARILPGVAHELRGPLTTISGVAQVASLQPGLGAELRSRVGLVQAQVERADALLRNVVAFARGPRRASEFPASLNDAVRRALELLAHEAKLDAVELRPELDFQILPSAGDPEELLEVVLYLVAAVRETARAARAHGPITLRTRAAGAEGARLELLAPASAPGGLTPGAAALVEAASEQLEALGGAVELAPAEAGELRLRARFPGWSEEEDAGARSRAAVVVAEPDLDHALSTLRELDAPGVTATLATSADVLVRCLRAGAGASGLVVDAGLAHALLPRMLPRAAVVSAAPGMEGLAQAQATRLACGWARRELAASRLRELAALGRGELVEAELAGRERPR